MRIIFVGRFSMWLQRRTMRKDVVWNTFFEDNSRYADIINAIGCAGAQVVSKDDLVDVDTKSNSKQRDMIRKVALGINFAIVGVENQDELDYELPVRIMYYDAVQYKKQVARIAKKVKAEENHLEPGEYLYGFKKSNRLFPVITFVLYAGVEPWDGSEMLYYIIDFTDIPDSLRGLVQNYEVKIVDIRRLADTSVFQTDVRHVFDFIRCAEDKETLYKLVNEDSYYQNMDEEAYEVISKYAKLKEDMVNIENYKGSKGGIDMCKGIRDLIEDSKEEGREAGVEQMQSLVIRNMLRKGMEVAEICELAECSVEDIERVKKEDMREC